VKESRLSIEYGDDLLGRFRGSTTVPTDVVKTRPDSCHESRCQLGADPRKRWTVRRTRRIPPHRALLGRLMGALNLPDEDQEVGLGAGFRAPNQMRPRAVVADTG
jgi:hypothetical protein